MLIETLLFRHECDDVTLAYIDDRPGRSGSHLRKVFEQFDRRSHFDASVSVRRERDGLRRYLYRANNDPDQTLAVADDVQIINEAYRVGIFDIVLIRKWLMEMTSENCWLRSRETHDESWWLA